MVVDQKVLVTNMLLLKIICNLCLTVSKSQSNVLHMNEIKADQGTPLLHMRGIEKIFPGVKALDGVDLDVRAGEVHCLLGQNGAGKSTMIKVLAGAHRHDGGTIEWMGEEVKLDSPVQALDLGIATMYQELDVVDGLTVAENIFLGHELARGGFSLRSEAADRTRAILKRLGHEEISPHQEVGTLSAAGKQIVSMARALSRDTKLIVMDEPSAVLDSEEVKNLFRVTRDLVSEGVAVIYISHRLEEIREVGDRITVLKDGQTVATDLNAKTTTTNELINYMTGRAIEYVFPERRADNHFEDAPVVLDVANISDGERFQDVSFSVRAGEVVGLTGLVGAGRSEILESIYGARPRVAGTVTVNGEEVRAGSVGSAVRHGMGLCPEERKSQGLILDEAVYRNITLSTFQRTATFGWLQDRKERQQAEKQVRDLDLRPADIHRAVRTLSGGNQQKAVLGRWLLHGCKVLLLDEPSRGVDVGARTEIYRLIRDLADSGVAVVVVSSEVEEVLGLSDNVLVISEGKVVHTGPASEINEHQVLDLVMEGSVA